MAVRNLNFLPARSEHRFLPMSECETYKWRIEDFPLASEYSLNKTTLCVLEVMIRRAWKSQKSSGAITNLRGTSKKKDNG